jgi:hypothetical protein
VILQRKSWKCSSSSLALCSCSHWPLGKEKMHQYLLEHQNERTRVDEWTYRADMATGSYEHVICNDSVTIYRSYRPYERRKA